MTRTASKPWWLEWEIGLLLALVGLAYSYHMNKLPFRGEETRRAQIAREMVLRGDWIVPRQQGEPFLSRPPLQNWIIAGMARLRGDFDETSTRLPSVIAMLACVGVIYGYGRTFLSRLGALGAAA
ncbi:MAG: glycosyltransferase family 39 protein, partial [Thermoguttaceae bacterium]